MKDSQSPNVGGFQKQKKGVLRCMKHIEHHHMMGFCMCSWQYLGVNCLRTCPCGESGEDLLRKRYLYVDSNSILPRKKYNAFFHGLPFTLRRIDRLMDKLWLLEVFV